MPEPRFDPRATSSPRVSAAAAPPSPDGAPREDAIDDDALEVTCHIELQEIDGRTHYRIVLERSRP